MLAATSPLVWYTTRATGTVALVLLTVSVALGILTATRAGGVAMPRFAVSELHRRISLVSMLFLAVHVLTAALDTFVPIGFAAIVVPFTSSYRTFWVGLGAVSFDLLLAIVGTSLLRTRISAGAWRGVHWLVYVSWPVALLHAVGSGTDLKFSWMDLVVAACVMVVATAAVWRLLAHPHRGGARTALPPRRIPAGAAAPVSERRVSR